MWTGNNEIFSSLWRWARRRHPKKAARWCKQKCFANHGGQDWFFFGEVLDDGGQPRNIRLLRASSTPIKRHNRIQGDANPYDPACETYFEKREEVHMRESFRGTRILRFLWYEQRGLCPVCHIKITRVTGWRLHYCVSRTMGGSNSAETCKVSPARVSMKSPASRSRCFRLVKKVKRCDVVFLCDLPVLHKRSALQKNASSSSPISSAQTGAAMAED